MVVRDDAKTGINFEKINIVSKGCWARRASLDMLWYHQCFVVYSEDNFLTVWQRDALYLAHVPNTNYPELGIIDKLYAVRSSMGRVKAAVSPLHV